MKKAFFIISLTVFLFFGATACSSALTPGITSQGKSVTVLLDENPTTGYTWAVSIDNQEIVTLANDQYTANKTDAKVVGSGGLHTYIFHAKGPGTALVTFELGQQWSGGQKGAETKKYQITVNQDGNIGSAKEVQ